MNCNHLNQSNCGHSADAGVRCQGMYSIWLFCILAELACHSIYAVANSIYHFCQLECMLVHMIGVF